MMKVTRSHALGNAKFNHDQYMTLIKLDEMNQKHWAICVLSVKYFSQSEDNILVYPYRLTLLLVALIQILLSNIFFDGKIAFFLLTFAFLLIM